jgi:hypothetical protein
MKSPVKPSTLSILGGEAADSSSSSAASSARKLKPPQAGGHDDEPPNSTLTTPAKKKSDFEALFDELAISSSRPWLFDQGDTSWEEFDHDSSIASSSCSSTVSPEDVDDDEDVDNDAEVPSNSDCLVRRVHFVETGPNEKDILRTEYQSTVDYECIREQWYTAQHFRKFRALCQETALAASRDVLYCQDFMDVYNRMSNGDHVPWPVLAKEGLVTSNNTSTTRSTKDYSDYRGLERAIFRNTLVTDKFSNIKGIVLAAKELSDNELAQVCHEFTATARGMARHLAVLDRLVVDTNHHDDDGKIPPLPRYFSFGSSSSSSAPRHGVSEPRQLLEI